jgi:hypothetical protein
MNDRIKLSLRVRPNSEAAPWVIAEIKRDEAEIERLQALHLERTKSTHKAFCEYDEKVELLQARIDWTVADNVAKAIQIADLKGDTTMRTYIFNETDGSPRRGCHVVITVWRIRKNRPELVGHAHHNPASWRGGRAEAQNIIHDHDGLPWEREHYELKGLLSFADMYDPPKGKGRNAVRLFEL